MARPPASNALLHVVCRGIVRAALPPERALRYSTPEGEGAWAPGWIRHTPLRAKTTPAPSPNGN